VSVAVLTAERSHAARLAGIPWYLWCSALAVTSAYIGGYWDISWHRSIGRDTFWSPPHMAIYACGVLAGICSAYLILTTTFARHASLRDVSVRIWGLVGPLGAFFLAWGGMAMLVSAPFDDWWHNAYGLDVKIISPPHMVLAAGFFGIELGAVMLLLAFMNRSGDDVRHAMEVLFLYVGGTVICESLLLKMEYITRSDMHSPFFYIVVVMGTPGVLVALAVASGQRWACTIMASVYTAFGLALLWILPFFPAEPKLGPVYQQVTHMIPWEFPLLVVVPALAIDLILQRTGSWRPLAAAPVAGLVFLLTFIAVQWPFASFLMTPLARNWFFGTAYMDFSTPVQSRYAQFQFYADASQRYWPGMLIAALISSLMMWLGLHAGRAMRKVRR